MCAATASPAAASSGLGGDGFYPAATFSSSPAPGALFMPVPDGSVAAAGLGLGLPAADSRGHYQLLLSGRALADRYRRIYTAALNDRDQGGGSAGHPASRCVPRVPFLAPHAALPCAPCRACTRVCVCLRVCTCAFIELSVRSGCLLAGALIEIGGCGGCSFCCVCVCVSACLCGGIVRGGRRTCDAGKGDGAGRL